MRLRNTLWEVLPSNKLTGMCRWMGAQFLDWIKYNRVAFSRELLECGRKISDHVTPLTQKNGTIKGEKRKKKKRISNWLTSHSVHKFKNVVNSVLEVKIVASQTFCKHIRR